MKLAIKLYGIFLEKDCSLIEINPLVTTKSGSLIAMDSKINFDDNALFRHRDYEKLEDDSQMNPLEVRARKFDIAYIKLSGDMVIGRWGGARDGNHGHIERVRGRAGEFP